MIANASRRSVFVDLAPLAPDGSNGGAAPSVLGLLARMAPRLDLHLLLKRDAADAAAHVVAAGARVHFLGEEVAEPRRIRRMLRRSPLGGLVPDGASLRRLGAEVLFSPLQTATFHEPGLRHVATAHDFQELAFPSFFTDVEIRRRQAFHADLRRCDQVVAVSRFTRDEAIGRLRIAPEKLHVIPPLVVPRERIAEREAGALLSARGLSPGGYAIYPANFWPHKNQEMLLEALALAPDVRLVLCGALDAGRARAAERAAALGVAERVTLLPYVSDAELSALLQSARFLVFPSLFEGFGIPVLEAFQLGIPVACSRIPALCELASDAALLFDPADPGAIAEALTSFWGDAILRERLAKEGRKRAAAFDDESTVTRWSEILTG